MASNRIRVAPQSSREVAADDHRRARVRRREIIAAEEWDADQIEVSRQSPLLICDRHGVGRRCDRATIVGANGERRNSKRSRAAAGP